MDTTRCFKIPIHCSEGVGAGTEGTLGFQGCTPETHLLQIAPTFHSSTTSQ